MRNAKRTLSGTISIDGTVFVWRLDREPQWCSNDGWRGLVIAVRHEAGQREALIEWPMPRLASNSVPYRQRPKIDPPRLRKGINAAFEAGWEPLSRGKPMKIVVREE